MSGRTMGNVGRGQSNGELDVFADGFLRCGGCNLSGRRWVRKKNTQEAGKGYLRALLLPGVRKSMAPMASRIGVDPNVLQQFVTDSPWDDEEVARTNIQIMMERGISGPDGVLVLDDTSIIKRGEKSVGVTQQYSGQVGDAANCQAAVSCLYVLPGKRNSDFLSWPVGIQLYLPKEWANDRSRRREARVPKDVTFLNKNQIGIKLIDRAVEEGVPFQAAVMDASYGSMGTLRRELRKRRLPYVVGVSRTMLNTIPEDTRLIMPTGQPPRKFVRQFPSYPRDVEALTPKMWAESLGEDEWHHIVWIVGSKGPLEGDFARVRVRIVHRRRGRRATDETDWLLLEKHGEELKAFLAWGLDDRSLEDLVRLAHTRWAIEQSYQQMKNELGLDHFEGRTWRGWHHHASLVMMAFSFLTTLRAKGETAEKDMLTLPEIRRRIVKKVCMQILMSELGLTKKEAKKALRVLPWLWDT